MSWDQAVKTIAPHIVKIETPNGWGTGFLAFWNHDRNWCGIATAGHVVKHADDWQQPIKVIAESQTPLLLQGSERVIFLDSGTDSAVVLFFKRKLQLPQVPITLIPMSEPCGIGADVSHFHGVAGHVRSVDEANAAKREFEAAQKLKAATDAVDAAGTQSPAATVEAPPRAEPAEAATSTGTSTRVRSIPRARRPRPATRR